MTLRILTLNLAHGRGTGFHQLVTPKAQVQANLDAVVRLIDESRAEVVALQEADAASAWSGRFNHLEYLAERTGLSHVAHGRHVEARGLVYGTGILSRAPIEASEGEAFRRNPHDTKGFLRARIESPLGSVDVISLHLDFKRSRERRVQLGLLEAYLGRRPDPAEHLVIAGDFNTLASSKELSAFAAARGLRCAPGSVQGTFPSGWPRRRIDYLFVSAGLSFLRHSVLPVRVSDHLPVWGELIREGSPGPR